MIQKVWPGRVVEESNLRVPIAALRQRLGAASIVKVDGRGYAYAAPMWPAAPLRPESRLPPVNGALLGRDEDLATLTQLMAAQRLVTLLGSGGIGKTRLAIALAEELQDDFADGVWWVDLAPLQSAAQICLAIAQAADHRFVLHAGQFDRAASLCQQLDGIPLALEMAGARMPVLGLEALHRRLGERLRLLDAGGRALPARQRTLQAALAWSHAMLTPNEQTVLRRLSVFAAAFRLESAQHLAADAVLDGMAVLQAVAALVDKSMLQVHAASSAATPQRYRLLETTRLFAAPALDACQERAAVEARHAQAMAALAERAQAEYWTHSDGDWITAWRADHDDFVLGFDRACAAGDAESAALIGEALHASADLTGLYGAVHDRVDEGMRLLPLAGALARALARFASELEHSGDGPAADAATAELRQIESSHWPPGQRVMGVALAGELDCSIDVGQDLGGQAAALQACGDAAAARDAIEQGLMLTDDSDALRQFAATLGPLALQFGHIELGARMLGAAQALRAREGELQRAWQVEREASLREALRQALDADTLARHETDGAGLGSDCLAPWLTARV